MFLFKYKCYRFIKTGQGGSSYSKIIMGKPIKHNGGSGGNIKFAVSDKIRNFNHLPLGSFIGNHGGNGSRKGCGSAGKTKIYMVPENTNIKWEHLGESKSVFLNKNRRTLTFEGASGAGYMPERKNLETHLSISLSYRKIYVCNLIEDWNHPNFRCIEMMLGVKNPRNPEENNVYVVNKKLLVCYSIKSSQNINKSGYVDKHSSYIFIVNEDSKLTIASSKNVFIYGANVNGFQYIPNQNVLKGLITYRL